ncbi:MAG: type II toxin-antitoxin system YafQ family toxin [Synergistaceae bacterium]|nr:type II toxin-antitoxin system YafQ family toxin [Synergistaceae bacterium]MBQ6114474.1 type II toxin-antitoxin system YafQ family toxin [Synergistaceae bacterium]MBQ6417127.1 type II toxin-antitoxin system YafQ family toxin [Synergistaceae bacterium]MBQ6665097.1 type II toxin-antitoxin system YafQ family toxin [Synergistaceae bacterium]MBR0186910.1 type II toxin-antitoxin system YafQ family toxin [Synergistaceae bacterium]
MRRVEQRSKFRHDFKREGRGEYGSLLQPVTGQLWKVVAALANNLPLPPKYRDHALHGEWEGSRDCHIKPDLVLVYTLEGDGLLILERLGSHADIFGM